MPYFIEETRRNYGHYKLPIASLDEIRRYLYTCAESERDLGYSPHDIGNARQHGPQPMTSIPSMRSCKQTSEDERSTLSWLSLI